MNFNFKNKNIVFMLFIFVFVAPTTFCAQTLQENQTCPKNECSIICDLPGSKIKNSNSKKIRTVEDSTFAKACGVVTAAALMSYFLGYDRTLGIRPVQYFFNRDSALLDFFIAISLVSIVFVKASRVFADAYFPITEFFRQLFNNPDDNSSDLTAHKFLEATLKNWPKIKKFVAPYQHEKFDVLYLEYINNGGKLTLTDDEINKLFFPDEQVMVASQAQA